MSWLSEARRAYIYRVLTFVNPLLVTYGVLAESTAALWLGLAGAVLATGGSGLAAANTPTSKES